MSNKIYYTFEDVQHHCMMITRNMMLSNWTPDWIVGITRGGLLPATLLSHWLKKPMYTLDVCLRDEKEMGNESNAWMAEAAYGYIPTDPSMAIGDPKRILIVDDINDSGATLRWIQQDWEAAIPPDEEKWENEIWHHSTRFACLVDNANSDAIIDYSAVNIAKTDEYNPWIVFPWEVDE